MTLFAERNSAKKEQQPYGHRVNQKSFGFHPLKQREIRAQFDGGAITSEGGGLLLREVEKRIGIGSITPSRSWWPNGSTASRSATKI